MTEFNPKDHNIPEVEAHLKSNPNDLQAVLDAEKAGKNRPTLVSALEAQVEATPQTVGSQPVEGGAAEPTAEGTRASDRRPVPGLLDGFERTAERGFRRKQS